MREGGRGRGRDRKNGRFSPFNFSLCFCVSASLWLLTIVLMDDCSKLTCIYTVVST